MNTYITDLMLNVIELDKEILSLFDTEDLLIQRDVLLNVLYTEKNLVVNVTGTDKLLYSYMTELNKEVDELNISKQTIRELYSKS
jgi:hypothetical protein